MWLFRKQKSIHVAKNFPALFHFVKDKVPHPNKKLPVSTQLLINLTINQAEYYSAKIKPHLRRASIRGPRFNSWPFWSRTGNNSWLNPWAFGNQYRLPFLYWADVLIHPYSHKTNQMCNPTHLEEIRLWKKDWLVNWEYCNFKCILWHYPDLKH